MVVGTNTARHKNGSQAVRSKNAGILTMDFLLPNGAAMVKVQHAIYGTDGSSWELWTRAASGNCAKWTKVGATVSTTSATLQAGFYLARLTTGTEVQYVKLVRQ